MRPAPARRRTPRSSPLIDANEVEERDRDEYIKKFHKTEGFNGKLLFGMMLILGGVCEDAQAGEHDDRAQKRLFEKATGDKEHDDNVDKTRAKDCEDYTQTRLFGDVQKFKEYGDGSTSPRPKLAEKNLQSRPPVRGDQVDEAPTAIRGGVPNDQGGGEVQGNQEVHPQDNAWQEILSKVEEMPLDTTSTFVEASETGKTATKILGGRLASSELNQVQDRVDQRP
jgi:hypothetical protein